MPKVSRRKRSTRSIRKRRNTKTSKVSAATKRYVRRVMPKAELKQSWNHINEQQLSTLAQGFQSLGPAITMGTASNQRVGNVINVSGLHLKGALYNNSTAESFVRIIIAGYNTAIGDPTTSLFRNGATGTISGVSGVNGLDAMYYPINKVDLHVYTDMVVRLAGSATGNSGANTRFFSKFVKFGGKKVEYKSNATYGDWAYTCMFIASDANDDTSTGTAVELSYLERLFYKDA